MMAVQTSFMQIERIADQIGANAALRLASFFGGTGRNLYIPTDPVHGHLLEKIIGREAFENLVSAFAGQSLSMPVIDIKPLRNAGRVWLLRESNLSPAQIGNLLGISRQRVNQIIKTLLLEGFTDLAGELDNEGEQA